MGAGVVDVYIVEAYAEVGDEPEASAVLEELGSGGAVKDGAEDLGLGKESLKLLEGEVPALRWTNDLVLATELLKAFVSGIEGYQYLSHSVEGVE